MAYSPQPKLTWGDVWSEIKKNRGWYFIVFLLSGLPPIIATIWPVLTDKKVPNWLAETGWPRLSTLVIGWLGVAVIIALIIVARSWFNVKYRHVSPEAQRLKSRLEGEIQDFVMMPLTGPLSVIVKQGKTLGVWLRVYIFNSSTRETGIKNFRLRFTVADQTMEVPYPEDQRIIQAHQRPSRWEEEKEFNNLLEFVRSGDTLRPGQHIIGYLCFYHPEFTGDMPKSKNLAVIVTDSWGQDWPITTKRFPVPPSERLHVPSDPD